MLLLVFAEIELYPEAGWGLGRRSAQLFKTVKSLQRFKTAERAVGYARAVSALTGKFLTASATCALSLALSAVALAATLSVHVQHRLAVHQNIHLAFRARRLPEGGYYYGVIVMKPYKKFTRTSPPPCSTSSNMQGTDYGYPQANEHVALALTPAKSRTGHWCPSAYYEGAIYAVPHAPPCESTYPCRSEPYKPPSPCWGSEGHRVCGVVAWPKAYAYPDGLPRPRATGTAIVAHFSVTFPSR
jgi:hypothetical protein